jgi:predicted AAA+ superfamily ATPase
MTSDATIRAAAEAQNPWWSPGRSWPRIAQTRRRHAFERLRRNLLDPELRRGTLLLGPRQVGKSTLLHQIAESLLDESWPPGNLTLFNFDDPRVRALGPDAGLIEEQLPSTLDPNHARVLLLDEVHLAPGWASWLKNAMDRDRRKPRSLLRVIATSSAASLLHRGSVESGQGRWTDMRIFGLSFAEHLRFVSLPDEGPMEVLRRAPAELERYLAKGGFPEHVHAEASEELRSRLREDIADKAIRRDLALLAGEGSERLDLERLKRLFVYMAQDSGSVVNAAERARDLDARPTTVARWLQLLVDACLLHQIEPHAPTSSSELPKASSRLAAKPKIYVTDHGLIPAFTLSAFPMAEPVVRARVTEAVVLRHLLELVPSREEIRYFRRRDGLECDFVFGHQGELYAVEATSSAEVDGKKAERFRKAVEAVGARCGVLIYRGAVGRREGNLRLLPLHRLLVEPSILLQREVT